jgi:hypothetical protein
MPHQVTVIKGRCFPTCRHCCSRFRHGAASSAFLHARPLCRNGSRRSSPSSSTRRRKAPRDLRTV